MPKICVERQGECYSTRFSELAYRNVYPRCWRIVDISDPSCGACVGPLYTTRKELLADLERYATDYGCDGAKPRPVVEWRNSVVGMHHWDGSYSFWAGNDQFVTDRNEALAMMSDRAADVLTTIHGEIEDGKHPLFSYGQTLGAWDSNPRESY